MSRNRRLDMIEPTDLADVVGLAEVFGARGSMAA
jgi:hypothetical protein